MSHDQNNLRFFEGAIIASIRTRACALGADRALRDLERQKADKDCDRKRRHETQTPRPLKKQKIQ